ncbi:hypothetical protein BH24CHL5_BH24CHL5_02020 [soil metagenome]
MPLAVVLSGVALALTMSGAAVLANDDGYIRVDAPPGNNLTICHATPAEVNPYVVITPSISSEGFVEGGHSDHTGDIIPPYYYAPTGFHYDGLNWDAEGQAIYENDCNVPEPTAPPTDAPTLPPTDAPTLPPTDAPTLPPTEPPAPTPTLPDTSAVPGPAQPMNGSGSILLVLLLIGSATGALLLIRPLRRLTGPRA